MLRLLGALLVMTGSFGFVLALASYNARKRRLLEQLLRILEEMEWELRYRLTALPQLCDMAADVTKGPLKALFAALSQRLSSGEEPSVAACMNGLSSNTEFPGGVRHCLRLLGESLGRYDLEGQLEGLKGVRAQIRLLLKELEDNGKERIRSYQTLVFCAGAALAILLI